jgi:hypothetical protein
MKRTTITSWLSWYPFVFIGLICFIWWFTVGSRPSMEYIVFNHNNDILGLDMLDHEGTFDYEPV